MHDEEIQVSLCSREHVSRVLRDRKVLAHTSVRDSSHRPWCTQHRAILPQRIPMRHLCVSLVVFRFDSEQARDYETPEHLASHIKRAFYDRELYESYLEWRKHPPSRQMMSIMKDGELQSLCSLCTQVAVIQAVRKGEL